MSVLITSYVRIICNREADRKMEILNKVTFFNLKVYKFCNSKHDFLSEKNRIGQQGFNKKLWS